MAAEHPSDRQLAAFVNGLLADNEQAQLEGHVEACQLCCDRLRQLTIDDCVVGLFSHLRRPFEPHQASPVHQSISDQLAALGHAIPAISEIQREILVRYYLRGEGLREIGQDLGLSLVEAASHLRRGIQCWRKHCGAPDFPS